MDTSTTALSCPLLVLHGADLSIQANSCALVHLGFFYDLGIKNEESRHLLVSDQNLVLEPLSENVIIFKFIFSFKVIHIHVHIAAADLSI